MKNDGGPAFPTHPDSPVSPAGWLGLSLRDYFAAKAMQALITMMARPAGDIAEQRIPLAEDAYLLADAMIAERAKE